MYYEYDARQSALARLITNLRAGNYFSLHAFLVKAANRYRQHYPVMSFFGWRKSLLAAYEFIHLLEQSRLTPDELIDSLKQFLSGVGGCRSWSFKRLLLEEILLYYDMDVSEISVMTYQTLLDFFKHELDKNNHNNELMINFANFNLVSL